MSSLPARLARFKITATVLAFYKNGCLGIRLITLMSGRDSSRQVVYIMTLHLRQH